MSEVETIRIVDENFADGFRVVNCEDFDDKKHTLFSPAANNDEEDKGMSKKKPKPRPC